MARTPKWFFLFRNSRHQDQAPDAKKRFCECKGGCWNTPPQAVHNESVGPSRRPGWTLCVDDSLGLAGDWVLGGSICGWVSSIPNAEREGGLRSPQKKWKLVWGLGFGVWVKTRGSWQCFFFACPPHGTWPVVRFDDLNQGSPSSVRWVCSF